MVELSRSIRSNEKRYVEYHPRSGSKRYHRTARIPDLPEGTGLLVTILPDEESQFWLGCSQTALDRIWNNPEDDAYGELLKK